MIYSFSTFKQPPIGSYDLNRSVAPGKLTCYSAAKSSQAIGYQIQIADFGSSDFGGKPPPQRRGYPAFVVYLQYVRQAAAAKIFF